MNTYELMTEMAEMVAKSNELLKVMARKNAELESENEEYKRENKFLIEENCKYRGIKLQEYLLLNTGKDTKSVQ